MSKSEVSIGPVTAKAGEKKQGFLTITHGPAGSAVNIPIIVVHGTQPGPNLLVDSCIHGDEYEGPVAIIRLCKELLPEKLKGILVGVPVMNPYAFEAGKRENPLDGVNLNRIFPGNPAGTISQRLAHKILTEIVYKVEYVVDLHSGGNIQILPRKGMTVVPFGTPLDKQIKDMVKLYNPELIWKSPPWTGGTIRDNAIAKGIPAITGESGGEGRCREETVQKHYQGTVNIMKGLGMLEGKPDIPEHKEIPVVEAAPITATEGGIFLPEVDVMQQVGGGQVLGRTLDVFGNEVECLKAPGDGIVALVRTFPMAHAGDWLCVFGKLVDHMKW